MTFDKPIIIQIMDKETELWSDLFSLHAHVNKSKQTEYLNAGAEQSKLTLTFEVRYFSGLKAIALNTQIYRIVFEGHNYNITDYDDYMLQHKTVKLLGVSY